MKVLWGYIAPEKLYLVSRASIRVGAMNRQIRNISPAMAWPKKKATSPGNAFLSEQMEPTRLRTMS